uniref:Uncharacterized protein n=1 Tax=Heterosigma akashiwo TaxID=2829 RepID=A0A7S4DA84_HETAK
MNLEPRPAISTNQAAEFQSPFFSYSAPPNAWEYAPPLPAPNCFLGAAGDAGGRVHIAGGGDSMYVGAKVYTACWHLGPHSTSWSAGPALLRPRCGLALARGGGGGDRLYALGGYGGGQIYHATVEVWDMGHGANEGRGWSAAAAAAPMAGGPRTGLGAGWGPDGALYAVGGSPDGLRGLKTAEKYDPREGKWHMISQLHEERGYCAAVFGFSGQLYAMGGTHMDTVSRSVEVYDPRNDTWSIADDLGNCLTDFSAVAFLNHHHAAAVVL